MIDIGINEEKTIDVKFPDDYREKNLAGKDASFDLKIKDIQERVKEIKVDEESIIKRLIDRGRSDDKPEIIKNRFKSYNSLTQPLIPFYEDREILFNINGMQDIEKVFDDIKKVIGI